jgi:hypothetical protein
VPGICPRLFFKISQMAALAAAVGLRPHAHAIRLAPGRQGRLPTCGMTVWYYFRFGQRQFDFLREVIRSE